MTILRERYPNTAGCRLDDGKPLSEGRAIDLYGRVSVKHPDDPGATLWVRESGTQCEEDQVQAECPVSLNDLVALRNGIDRMLQDARVSFRFTTAGQIEVAP